MSRRHDLPLALLVATVYLLVSFFSEKIAHCNGFGDDGCAYGRWALDFPRNAMEAKLGSYYIQRSFPSLVIWWTLKTLHVTLDPPNVIRAFQIANSLCIFVATFTWTKIARILEIRPTMTLFGAAALFCNYGVLKFTTWYPVLGDLWGYAVGFVCLWAYLTRRPWVIIPLAVMVAFTWPSAIAPALCLLFFSSVRPNPDGSDERAPFRLDVIVAGAAALAWAVFVTDLVNRHYWPPMVGKVDTMPQLTRLATLVGSGFVFFAVRALADRKALFNPLTYARPLATPWGLSAVVIVFATRWAIARWSVPENLGFMQWFSDTGILTTTKPAIFAVAHPVYWGPVVIVLALRWRRVTELVHAHGPGLVACVALSVVFGLDAEARHAYSFFAILLPFAIKVLDEADLDARAVTILTVLTVLFSKLWLTLPSNLSGQSWDFPSQTVFLSQGPWMANWFYFVQAIVVAAVAVWLHRAMRGANATTGAPSTA